MRSRSSTTDPRESMESLGGTRAQQIMAAIPQTLMPQLIATALHRFDINLRTSVLLGYVGVGGIGLAIADSLRTLDYQRGMALAVLVLLLCIGIELVSGAIRAALMRSAGQRITGGTWVDRLFNQRPRIRSQRSPPHTAMEFGAVQALPLDRADRDLHCGSPVARGCVLVSTRAGASRLAEDPGTVLPACVRRLHVQPLRTAVGH